MSNILVDPIILMTPSEHESKEEVQAWFDRLEVWSQEVSNPSHTWYHLLDATHKLLENHRFPKFEVLQRLASLHRLDVDIRAMGRRIQIFFMSDASDITRFFDASEYIVEAEEGSIDIYPAEISSRWIGPIQDKMIQVLIILCTCKFKVLPFTNDFFIATLKLMNGVKEVKIVLVIKDALIAQHKPDIGKRVVQTFPLLYTPEDLAVSTEIPVLWNQGIDSIKNIIKKKAQYSWPGIAPMEFQFGEHFFTSIKEAGLDQDKDMLAKIIRAAAAVLVDRLSELDYKPRHIRENEAADVGPMTRSKDGAKAWRITLVDKKVGWRMQYWRIPTSPKNVIEFMIVCKKNDPVRVY